MKLLVLLLGLIIVSSTYTDQESHQIFQAWKLKYSRVYTETQEEYRLQVFRDNMLRIDRLNEEQPSAKFALNKFADMTPEEFAASYLAEYNIEPRPIEEHHVPYKVFAPAPESYDWTIEGVVNPAKDQGQCNSQWAFAAIASIESENAIINNVLYDLSEQQLLDCDTTDQDCNGGTFDNAFTFLISEGGVMESKEYRYLAKKGTCKFDQSKVKVQVFDFQILQPQQENIMVNYLYNLGPLATQIHGDELQFYVSGIFHPLACPSKHPKELDHAVNPVGYGTEGGKSFWKCKNSWGPDWGEDGFFRIVRGMNMCGIADNPSSVFIKKI